MRHIILFTLLILLSAPLALAQNSDDYKKAEYFIGYSYENADARIKARDVTLVNSIPVTDGILTTGGSVTTLAPIAVTGNSKRVDMNGFNSSITLFFSPRVGLTGDVSGNFRKENETFIGAPYRAQIDIYNFLAGPQVRLINTTRYTPYVRALFGVAYSRNRFAARSATAPFQSFSDDTTDFAMGLGGGVDYRINGRVSYRILQADYNPIFRRDRVITTSNGTTLTVNGKTENNVRFSTGIVLH